MNVIFITGTDTDVGKTLTTAALAAALSATGSSVAMYKPTQSGVAADGHGDTDEVMRLGGIDAACDGIRLDEAMAPRAAAARAGQALPDLAHHVDRIAELAASHDHVLVEGAGGLLVELDNQRHTLVDLAGAAMRTANTQFVVVCRSGLGTLNHTGLTLEVLRYRGFSDAALVIGSWPAVPSEVESSNRAYLEDLMGTRFLGALPAGAAALQPAAFRALAPGWLKIPAPARGDG